ncbi:MAG: succinate dehydrogenase, cytochrome b556 subunit [Rickettsiales bacterium]
MPSLGNNVREKRPLSPHLSVYKPQISTVLSILHRMTGVANYIGLVLAALWICCAAFYPEGNGGWIAAFFSSAFGKILLFGWTFSLFYHLFNGIRHLCWDVGKGFSLPAMHKTGWAVVVASIVCTVGCWIYVLGAAS